MPKQLMLLKKIRELFSKADEKQKLGHYYLQELLTNETSAFSSRSPRDVR